MAKYLVTKPAYVENRYLNASPADPVVVEFSDEVAPSRGWEPLDKGAQAALLKLGVKKDIKSPLDIVERKSDVDPTATMSDLRKATQGKDVR